MAPDLAHPAPGSRAGVRACARTTCTLPMTRAGLVLPAKQVPAGHWPSSSSSSCHCARAYLSPRNLLYLGVKLRWGKGTRAACLQHTPGPFLGNSQALVPVSDKPHDVRALACLETLKPRPQSPTTSDGKRRLCPLLGPLRRMWVVCVTQAFRAVAPAGFLLVNCSSRPPALFF